jgi:quinol monooxygenase YgiN
LKAIWQALLLATVWVSGFARAGDAVGAAADELQPARVLTYFEANSDAVGRCKSRLGQYLTAVRQYSSLADVMVLQEIDRPQRFIVLETADRTIDLAAAEVRGRQALTALNPLLIAPADRRTHRDFADVPAPPVAPVASGSAHVAGKSAPAKIYVVAHLDLGPPDQARGQAALAKMVAAARNSPGNLRFDAWQQSNRPNHFNIVAAWSSQAALDDFANSAAAREYRVSVALLIGSPYDERLYRRID